jgi:hypothetical protein
VVTTSRVRGGRRAAPRCSPRMLGPRAKARAGGGSADKSRPVRLGRPFSLGIGQRPSSFIHSAPPVAPRVLSRFCTGRGIAAAASGCEDERHWGTFGVYAKAARRCLTTGLLAVSVLRSMCPPRRTPRHNLNSVSLTNVASLRSQIRRKHFCHRELSCRGVLQRKALCCNAFWRTGFS